MQDMKKIHYWIIGFVLLLSLTLTGVALAANPLQGSPPVGIDQQVEVGDEFSNPPVLDGGRIEAVATQYTFSSSSGAYTEILTGTVHGTPSNDDQNFNAIPLGFTFRFNNVDYTQVSIQNNGFVAMGASVTSSYYPLSTGTSNNVIAGLARDLQGNGTTSELRSLVEGSAPDRVFTIQYKHYKRYGTSYAGDDLNFQIKLYETSGQVRVVYGPFTVLTSATATPVQVGLRGNSNSDFNNRTTTSDWAASTAGLTNADTMALTDLIYPPSGLTYTWALTPGLFLDPASQSGTDCPGRDITYQLTVINQTGVAQSFNLAYTSLWPSSGPTSTGMIPNNSAEIIEFSVHVPWAAEPGDSDVLTIDVTSTTGGFSETASVLSLAALVNGYTDYSNVPAGREVRGASVVYSGGKLYKIGGYGYVSGTGAPRAWLDIYDIATDIWTQGADMPGARYWIDCEEIGGKIYCAGGYLTTGTNTLYIYDIALGTWSTAASTLPANRYNYASVKLNGKYYIIGGYTTATNNAILEYDPLTDTWNSSLPNMVTARRYAHAAVMGGKIYVAGGFSASSTYLDTVEVFDPSGPSWTAGTPMPSPWVNAADGVLYDRFMILTGGSWNSTSGASNGALMYDALTDQWSWLPLYNHILYGAEGDGDGTQFWTVSGRMYENATWSNSPYTTLLDECPACVPVTTADFSVNPLVPRPGIPATFTGTADGTQPEFNWDFGDLGTGEGAVVTHTYNLANTYTVEMTASTCDGANSVVATHDVLVEAGPLANITPSSLASTQCPDVQVDQTVNVCNDGSQALTWSLTEVSPISWLSETPTSGSVIPTECEEITATFDSMGLLPAIFNGMLEIATNDSLAPVVDLPITMTVAGPPTNAGFTYTPGSPMIGDEVSFNGLVDSLVPVDFSWNFGDGNTGTGQNPTHAYQTYGTYTVTMTASACGGSDVYTSTVTVEPCFNFLHEDFEGTFPPAGWTIDNHGLTHGWLRNDQVPSGRPNYAGGDGFAADADVDRYGSGSTMNTELRTITIDLSEVQTTTLNYMAAYNFLSGAEYADTDISVDGGTTWANLVHWTADHSAYGPGELVTVDLTPFVGYQNVMLRFYYYAPAWDYYFEVDQVNVIGCIVPDAEPDIVVTPTELTQTLQANQTADETFNIANIGLLPLDWTVDVGCGVPVSWLSAAPLAGTVPVYHDTDVNATFTSGSLAIDTYQAPICVNSNDPDSPTVEITATLIVTGTADIELDLPTLAVALPPDASSTLTGTVCNVGDGPLNWTISEVASAMQVASQDMVPQARQPARSDIFRLPDGSVDCAAYQDYTGREPAEVAAACPVSVPQGLPTNPLAPTDIGYAQDIGYISDNFVSFTLNNFTGQTVVGTSTNVYYGMDFDPAAQVLYALEDTSDMLGTINLANGAFTPLVSSPPGGGAANWTGLSIDPVTGVFYASTATDLYTIDHATGVSTLVGPFGTTLMIDIAINMDEQMYGHDIGTDSIYSINTTTGAATLIGPTGYGANYAQGMDFDNEDGTLYIFLYIGSGANVYGTVNLSTGAVTPLAVSSPQGEFEGATMTVGFIDLPWLSEAPTGGTLLPGDCTDLDVTYDSTGLAPDTYTGGLKIASNDPDEPEITLPVTLTVANLSMEFNKTVGIVPGVCASTASIAVPPGTEVVYCYSADNTSALTYSMLSIYDSELGQLFDHHMFVFPPGENVYHLETATILTDTTNTADFTLFFDETHTISATDSATVTVTKADLAITKTGPAEAIAGDPITYTVSVENLGPDAATHVELVDTLPAGATFVAAPDCVYASGAVSCSLASLPDGETATFEITISMAVAGEILNTADVTADQLDLNLTNNHDVWSTAVAPSTSYIFLPIIFKN
jgi:uncharacterized repeat protein (TIGR01451 family)